MTDTAGLIAGDDLKAEALRFIGETRAKIEGEQRGLRSIFDSWCMRVLTRLVGFDPTRSWEDSVARETGGAAEATGLQWDLQRLRLFLDRWRQGRFVDYAQRERSGVHYQARFGTEFGPDVLLTCQGAPSLMRWRDIPLMKNVFDFAMYPALVSELRPHTIFEIGSGLGASAMWLADHLAMAGVDGRVYSADRVKATTEHPRVTFSQGDCAEPERLFDMELLRSQPHPWLVIEDAHENVGAVLEYFHAYLAAGDYLVVEDSDVKRDTLRRFVAAHPGAYLVDTRFTDNFGRNATCAADSIFIRIK